MIRLAANLSTMFGEVPLLERFGRAAAAGFTSAEMQFPYEVPAEALAAAARAAGMAVVLINAPAGDLAGGERGLAVVGGDRFEASILRAVATARAVECPRVHVLVGKAATGLEGVMLAETAGRLRWAAGVMAAAGIELILEALNAFNEPGYALLSLAAADTLRLAIGSANVRLMFDQYHAARRGEDLVGQLRRFWAVVGHVQISRPPDRSEPEGPEIAGFLAALDGLGYAGFVGCEYRPRSETVAGLGWARGYLNAPGTVI